ncbi:hypothetical protein Vadar_008418 [Vaccinium darrowii]|uniref:Uncharacterized protein n=1 Tax=Vaccinium darrowii TaxID=229202 RepID=A0ACB7YLB4_9ERIC|nr:hypothetical protein Vadar_008418 [Vaccinium darrowii]
MAGREKTDVGSLRLPPPASLTVLIAIKGNSESKDVGIVNWALEKFVPEGIFIFKLIHVRPVIRTIPTAVGSFPLSDVRREVVEAYRKEIYWRTGISLLPYKKMCAQKRVQAEIVQIESDDVIDAISMEVYVSTVEKLVIGASLRGGMCSRCGNESTDIAESMPKFCTVYTVSKGKLSSLRPSDLGTHRVITIPSRMIHSSSNESSFDNSKSQAGAAVDDHVGLHSVIQAPNCRPNQAVLNRGSQMQRHKQVKPITE